MERFITLNISPTDITTVSKSNIIRGTVGARCLINFTGDWDNYEKTVVITSDSVPAPFSMHVTPDSDNTAVIEIPWEICRKEGKFKIGAFASSASEILPTLWSEEFDIISGSFSYPDAPFPPTPTVYGEILEKVKQTIDIAQSVRDDADGGLFKGDKGDQGEPGVTSYATHTNAGLIKSGYNGFEVDSNGQPYSSVNTKERYDSLGDYTFVGKGALKELLTEVYAAISNKKSISSIALNADYTLTIYYTDGTTYTTTSIRGERGNIVFKNRSSEEYFDGSETVTLTDSDIIVGAKVDDFYFTRTNYVYELVEVSDSSQEWELFSSIKGDTGAKGDTGEKGDTGATGNGIVSIEKTATVGNVDTYTITFTDGTTTTFDVINGAVTSVNEKTGDVDIFSSEIGAAKTDGYYEGMTVGNALNLLDEKAVGVSREFVYDTTSGDSSISDSGTATIEKIKGKTLVFNQLVDADTTTVTVPNGHKYRFYDKDGTDSIMTSNGTAFAVTGSDDMVTDLTQMYGSTVANSMTLAEFKAQFPLDYYEYNPGELISFNGTGIKTVGFNQLDEDGHIQVLKDKTYRIEGTYTSLKDSAGNDVIVTNNEFTPTANDTYTMVDGSCVHLKWSGYRNGEYGPYWSNTLSLPISTYFPDGMKSVGTVYDELTKDKAIKRIGKVDLGTLTWGTTKAYGYTIFYAKPTGIARTARKNVVCSKYVTALTEERTFADKFVSGESNHSYSEINVVDSSYTDATAFKTAMSGVYLYYELAEPVETAIDPPLNLNYKVDDFGTEQLLPENTSEPITTPFNGIIKYSVSFPREIANLPKNYTSGASLDNLLSVLGNTVGGTFTRSYNSETNKYNFTFTSSDPVLKESNSLSQADMDEIIAELT